MNPIKTIIVAAALSLGYLGGPQAAETVKPLQGVSFHTGSIDTGSIDAVVYFVADKGTCKLVLTLAEEFDYAPERFEKVVEAGKSTLHQIDNGKALEFACHADAQAMTIDMQETVADKH